MVIGDGISFANEVKKRLDSKVNLQIFKNFGTAMINYDGFNIEFVGSRKELSKSSRIHDQLVHLRMIFQEEILQLIQLQFL